MVSTKLFLLAGSKLLLAELNCKYMEQAFLDVFLALEVGGFAGNLRFLDILP